MTPPDTLRPECEFLLICSRIRLDAEARLRLDQLLSSPVDWKDVIRLARTHGLIPLLSRNLKEISSGRVPEEARAQLAQMSSEIGRISLRMTAELLRVVKALNAEGVLAVVIKGPALAQSIYGDISLRRFGDLDLLIRPSETTSAVRVLQNLGYQCDFDYSHAAHDIHLNAYYNFSLASPTSGIKVELHHRLTLPCFQSERQLEAILDRTQEISLGGHPMRVLSPEDQVIYLCAHGVKHIWERWDWICAIAAIASGDAPVDWSVVEALARAAGDERIVWIGLLLAESFAGVPVPSAPAHAARRDRAAATLAAYAHRRLIREAKTPEAGESFFYLLRARRLWDRLAYCWSSLTTPSLADIAFIRLPRPLRSLYALSRPLRVIKTYANSVSRALIPR